MKEFGEECIPSARNEQKKQEFFDSLYNRAKKIKPMKRAISQRRITKEEKGRLGLLSPEISTKGSINLGATTASIDGFSTARIDTIRAQTLNAQEQLLDIKKRAFESVYSIEDQDFAKYIRDRSLGEI